MNIQSKTIEMVPISQIKDNSKNPNRHDTHQIERLSKIIKESGFRNPLIVSNRTGLLVSGHCRKLAAIQLGMTHLPVIYQDFKDEATEYTYLVADNEISRWSELDRHLVYEELKVLDIGDIDLLGIENFENIVDIALDDDLDLNTEPSNPEKMIDCPNCGERFNYKKV